MRAAAARPPGRPRPCSTTATRRPRPARCSWRRPSRMSSSTALRSPAAPRAPACWSERRSSAATTTGSSTTSSTATRSASSRTSPGHAQTLIEHNLFQEQGVASTTTIAGNGNGLYASEHRDVMIRENLFVDNDQTLAIDTRTLTQGGLPGGGRDVTFTRNVSRGGDGPVFTSLHGVTITDNDIRAPASAGSTSAATSRTTSTCCATRSTASATSASTCARPTRTRRRTASSSCARTRSRTTVAGS